MINSRLMKTSHRHYWFKTIASSRPPTTEPIRRSTYLTTFGLNHVLGLGPTGGMLTFDLFKQQTEIRTYL